MQFVPNDILRSLPEWLTAIGTLLAVIVALYLARRDKRIQCVTNTSIYVLIDSANPNSASEFVTIIVTNVGTRVFTISSISWRMGIFKKQNFLMIPALNVYSSTIPVKLNDGEQASFYFPVEDFRRTSITNLLERAPKKFRRLWIWFTRIQVHSTTGDSFTFHIRKSIRQEFRGTRKSGRSQTAAANTL